MRMLNRSAILIKPKHKFITWANTYSLEEGEFTREYFEKECGVFFMIPYCLKKEEAREYISMLWDDMFTKMLRDWNSNEWSWPKERTKKMFQEWFTVEFCSDVTDTVIGAVYVS